MFVPKVSQVYTTTNSTIAYKVLNIVYRSGKTIKCKLDIFNVNNGIKYGCKYYTLDLDNIQHWRVL